jgi:mycothiol synthase
MQMAQVRIRPYRNGDEEGILSVWRRALPGDPLHPDLFAAKVLADPNLEREGLLVAERQGEPVGFAVALVRRQPLGPEGDLDPDTGWVTAFGVVPEARRQGVGSALLEAAEGFVRARGRRRLEVSPYAPGYFWPGVDRDRYPEAEAFLQARGYRVRYEAVAMDRNLVGFAVPSEVRRLQAELERAGFTFTHLSPRHVRSLIEFNARVFYADWVRAMRETVARRVPWSHTLICLKDDEVVGYAQFGAYDHVPDRFGPFGVDDALRGKGVGKVLLYRTLEAMAAEGFHDAWFLWTGLESPAGHLYRRAGFSVTRRFAIMARQLEGGV